MSNMHTHLDAARKSELAQDPAEHPRRAHPVKTADPVLRALSTAEAAFTRYASHHLRQAGKPGEDAAKRRQQAAANADLAQAMREGIAANYARSYQVPQGWKLVPCEPTREMLDKARENLVRDGEIDPMLKSAYAAMLSATPKLVTAQAQPKGQPMTDEQRGALLWAAINCPHSIDDDRVVLERDPKKPLNALGQLHARLCAHLGVAS